MRLDALQPGDRALLHMERYVDEGTRSYSPFAARSEVAERFQPRSPEPYFEVETVYVPRARVTLYEAEPASPLRALYVDDERIRFPVHPEAWASGEAEELRAMPRGAPLRVAPTASTRTVLVLEPDMPSHFLKLHCPRRISRFVRELRRKNINNSVAVSRELAELTRGQTRFGYLCDAFGVTFGSDAHAWGFLVRERLPTPSGSGVLVPCFALFGGDLQQPSDPPLVRQLIERLGVDPTTFVLESILLPVVESWARVARERGILLESHAQNMLLELDAGLRPGRIVHRDFDVWIDREARRDLGLATTFIDAAVGADTGRARAPYYSLIYDRFVGHEFFDYLLNVVAIDRDAIRAQVAAAFHRAFPDAAQRFPADTMFYFSNTPTTTGHHEVVDLKTPPEWR
jgi:hypothetical protein